MFKQLLALQKNFLAAAGNVKPESSTAVGHKHELLCHKSELL